MVCLNALLQIKYQIIQFGFQFRQLLRLVFDFARSIRSSKWSISSPSAALSWLRMRLAFEINLLSLDSDIAVSWESVLVKLVAVEQIIIVGRRWLNLPNQA